MPPDHGPSSGSWRRTARLASLPAGHAARSAAGLGRRLAGRSGDLVAAQVQQRTAEQLFATLGELKGGAMKLGQALSAMEAALPPPLVEPYRAALVRLQEAAPAMPLAAVHDALDDAFPAGWRRLFESFDERAVAAASIGQVHRAVLRDGTPVAVKLQYPGAAAALGADVAVLERLAPLIRVAAPGLDAPALLAQLRAGLERETDYVLEADAQSAFAAAFRGDADVHVPEVLVVEDRVLVTRWLDGTPLSRIIATGTEAERDRCGLLLLRLLLSSPRRAGLLHGDPHPGNFRLLPDGRLGVLDFGATEPLPGGWPAALGPLLTALRVRDGEAVGRILEDVGVVDPDRWAAPALLHLLGPYADPLRVERFCFERAWLQELTRRSSDPRSADARTLRSIRLPARHLLLQRVAFGLAGVLTSLGSWVPVAQELRRELPDYH
jgi:predicted unusual protein kinase regulating ubiquinone biosynthesis (AarF/ABC1/UbiB family)